LPPLPLAGASLPTWKIGDEWAYRWESPQGMGTFVWSLDREEQLDGVAYYVVKSGTAREIYYRKSDFAVYMDKLNGEIETRFAPPAAFVQWPPTPGAKWELRYTRERPLERQTEAVLLTCESGAVESLTVPAGTFETMKITCRNARTGVVTYDVWPSLSVKHIVRERTLFSYGIRERELIGFKLR
jgi:hypothetical protein